MNKFQNLVLRALAHLLWTLVLNNRNIKGTERLVEDIQTEIHLG